MIEFVNNSPQPIKNVFGSIKKVKLNKFIQPITCFKWLLPLNISFDQTVGVTTPSGLSDFVDFVRISKISQDNHYVNKWVFIRNQKYTIVNGKKKETVKKSLLLRIIFICMSIPE